MTIITLILQGTEATGIGVGALVFMLASMGAVIGLTSWCFYRILSTKRHFDPDGTGPARSPVPGETEQGRGH
jgi:hypothetical protein